MELFRCTLEQQKILVKGELNPKIVLYYLKGHLK